MPAASERIVNKALSGTEMRELILKDFMRLLDNEGMLNSYVAYGRVAWEIILKLHTDNYITPDTQSFIDSQRLNDTPVGNFPLQDGSDKETKSATKVTHNVTSPNAERIANGMGIQAEVRQNDGTVTMETIHYPVDTVEAKNIAVEDVTKETLKDWNK